MKHEFQWIMCAFCVLWEVTMVNQAFMNLSVSEKQSKLRTVLRNKTGDALTEAELQTIMENVDLGRQYVICTCYDVCGLFQKLPRSGTLASFLIGDEKLPHTNLQLLLYASIVSQDAITVVVDMKQEKSALYILLPRNRTSKGELS